MVFNTLRSISHPVEPHPATSGTAAVPSQWKPTFPNLPVWSCWAVDCSPVSGFVVVSCSPHECAEPFQRQTRRPPRPQCFEKVNNGQENARIAPGVSFQKCLPFPYLPIVSSVHCVKVAAPVIVKRVSAPGVFGNPARETGCPPPTHTLTTPGTMRCFPSSSTIPSWRSAS